MSRVPQITYSSSQRRFGNVLPPPMDDFNSRVGLDKHPVKRTCIVSPYFPDAKDLFEIGSATLYSDIMHIMLLCLGLILPLYIDLIFFFFKNSSIQVKGSSNISAEKSNALPAAASWYVCFCALSWQWSFLLIL